MRNIFIVIVIVVISCITTSATNVAMVVKPTGKIPKGYNTYSLFLVCNPGWLGPDKKDDLRDLYLKFRSFGLSIGDKNLAVWFWKGHPQRDGKSSRHMSTMVVTLETQDVDVERSVRFCKSWDLRPSTGPYVVITSKYPTESQLSPGFPKEAALFQLGGMDKKQISDLLGKLADQLLLNDKVPVQTTPIQSDNRGKLPSPDSLWVRLLVATQSILSDFGCSWSFKVDAGVVKSELKSCQPKSL